LLALRETGTGRRDRSSSTWAGRPRSLVVHGTTVTTPTVRLPPPN